MVPTEVSRLYTGFLLCLLLSQVAWRAAWRSLAMPQQHKEGYGIKAQNLHVGVYSYWMLLVNTFFYINVPFCIYFMVVKSCKCIFAWGGYLQMLYMYIPETHRTTQFSFGRPCGSNLQNRGQTGFRGVCIYSYLHPMCPSGLDNTWIRYEKSNAEISQSPSQTGRLKANLHGSCNSLIQGKRWWMIEYDWYIW